MKTCPFKNEVCNNECALFVSPEEVNELVLGKLTSIGVLNRNGMCSLKTAALSANRYIFENTITTRH